MQRTTSRSLATLPAYFDERRERLLAGAAAGHRLPAVLLDRVCASVEAHLAAPDAQSAWYGPLARLAGESPRFAEAGAQLRQLIGRELRPAYGRWLELLRGQYSAHCRDSIGLREEPDGEACYAFLAREYTTTDATPAEIHATGIEEVARIRAAMQAVATRAGCNGDVARAAAPVDRQSGLRPGLEGGAARARRGAREAHRAAHPRVLRPDPADDLRHRVDSRGAVGTVAARPMRSPTRRAGCRRASSG